MRITEAKSLGSSGQLDREIRRHLHSPDARLDVAFRTLGGKATVEAATGLARKVNVFRPDDDAVGWRCLSKSRGGYRPVCKLPNRRKAGHYLIKDVIEALGRPALHDYQQKGSGRDALIEQVKLFVEGGSSWCVIGDVRSCFQSVKMDALYDALPLPDSVICHTLDSRNISFTHDYACECDGSRRNGPEGLIQGSPASNAILSWLFKDMPTALVPEGSAATLFTDNVLVSVRSEDHCRMAEEALRAYFGAHPAGPFHLVTQRAQFTDTVEHLGYALTLTGRQVTIEPCHHGWENIFGAAAIDECSVQACDDAELRFRRRIAGYRLWSDQAPLVQDIIADIRNDREYYAGIDKRLAANRWPEERTDADS